MNVHGYEVGTSLSLSPCIAETCIDDPSESGHQLRRAIVRLFTVIITAETPQRVAIQVVHQERNAITEHWTDVVTSSSRVLPVLSPNQAYNIRTALADYYSAGGTSVPGGLDVVFVVDIEGNVLFSGSLGETYAAIMDGSEFRYLFDRH